MKEWYKHCPFCDNEIRAKAIKCQYCWEFLNEEKTTEETKETREKECPFCFNEIDVDAIKCPFCKENLNNVSVTKKHQSFADYFSWTVRHKNRWLRILWLLIIDFLFFHNIHFSPYKWWYIMWQSIFRYVIFIFIIAVINKKINQKEEIDNPTKNKITAVILYILWYFTFTFVIAYFWLYSYR